VGMNVVSHAPTEAAIREVISANKSN